MTDAVTTDNPIDAVKQWFGLMGRYCASVDYDAAERIFAEDVVSFGTTMDIVRGRKALRQGQWESIWGNISNFKMDLENIHARGNGNQAWAWLHGLPSALTAITSRSTGRAGRRLRWSVAMESGWRCIATFRCIRARRSALSAGRADRDRQDSGGLACSWKTG